MTGLRVRTNLHEGARPPFTPWQAGSTITRFAPESHWPRWVEMVLALGVIVLLRVALR